MRGTRIVPLGLLLGCLAGCATEPQPPPRLVEVCRAADDSACIDWVWAGEQAELKLLGDDLSPVWQVDLGDDQPPDTLGAFQAWIGPATLEQVALSPETLRGHAYLVGRLPGELAVGLYPAGIQSPSGQVDWRGQRFEIKNPLQVELAMDHQTLPRGATARLSVTVDNRSSAALDQVRIELRQGGDGSFRLPADPAAFSLAGQQSLTVDLDLIAASTGGPELAVTISALAAGRVPVQTARPALLDTAVLEPAELSLSGAVEPPSVAVGEAVTLSITVRNDGQVAARDLHLLEPQAEGNGQLAWAPDPGVQRDLEPGQQAVLRWSATAQARGTAWIRATVEAEEALSARPLEAQIPTPVRLDVE